MQSRFDQSRYSAAAAPAPATLGPRVIGRFIRIGFTNNRWRSARFNSWVGVNELGRLEIKGEDFTRDRPQVAWIIYEAIDDRFGIATRGQRAVHVFGTPPVLQKRIDGIWELAGGSYTVGPEGIRN